MDKIWNFFGEIRCLNLYERQDRYQSCTKIFTKYNIPVRFYQVHKHPNNAIADNFRTHIDMIKQAYDKNYETVLIFEDDVDVNELYMILEHLEKAVDFMKTNKDWEIFYLGHLPQSFFPSKKINDWIYKVHSVCTHAYVVHRRLMEKVRDAKYEGKAIDIFYLNSTIQYALYPMIFYQGCSPSSLRKIPFASKIPWRIFGAKLAERYMVNINISWILLVAIFAGLFYFGWRYKYLILAFLVMCFLLLIY
jgi:hypothetical protein